MTDSLEKDEIDVADFQHWLNETAAAEGVSSSDVLNQLISTYWVMSELADSVGKARGTRTESTAQPEEITLNELASAIGQDESPDGGEQSAAVESLVTAVTTGVAPAEPASKRADDEEFVTAEELEGEVEALLTRYEALEEVIAERIDVTEGKLEVVFSQLNEDLQTTVSSVEALSTEVSQLTEESEEYQERIDAIADQLDETDTVLDEFIEDFDHLADDFERHLRTAYDRLDEMEHRLHSLVELLDPLLTELSTQQRDRARFEAILQKADQESVRQSQCQACEETVSLTLLAAPNCPHCDARFSDLQIRDGWVFTYGELVPETSGRKATSFSDRFEQRVADERS